MQTPQRNGEHLPTPFHPGGPRPSPERRDRQSRGCGSPPQACPARHTGTHQLEWATQAQEAVPRAGGPKGSGQAPQPCTREAHWALARWRGATRTRQASAGVTQGFPEYRRYGLSSVCTSGAYAGDVIVSSLQPWLRLGAHSSCPRKKELVLRGISRGISVKGTGLTALVPAPGPFAACGARGRPRRRGPKRSCTHPARRQQRKRRGGSRADSGLDTVLHAQPTQST